MWIIMVKHYNMATYINMIFKVLFVAKLIISARVRNGGAGIQMTGGPQSDHIF